MNRRRRTLGDIPQDVQPDPVGEIIGGMAGVPGYDPGYMTALPNEGIDSATLNKTTFINIGYSVQTTSEEALPANRARNYLLIQNRSANAVDVSFGNKADGWNSIVILSGGNYEPFVVPNSSVNLLAAIADSQVVIVEGTGPQRV